MKLYAGDVFNKELQIKNYELRDEKLCGSYLSLPKIA